ncbi:MMPL family transporter [Sediminibacillus massiliensis]|uniref:MMPL family transporter n=1 Tax=Sediminibacillus massiliensis TaxID=1926277 RepID=UPI0009887AD4|nr:MMPL family transporter [Sediminibacillus massiliensis]
MRFIIKFRWLIAVLILALTVTLSLTAPNLTELANEKGQTQLPSDVSSSQANQILEDAGLDDNTISVVVTLDETLNEDLETQLEDMIGEIEEFNGVQDVTTPFVEDEDIREQLMSEDEKTILIPVTVSGSDEEIEETADQIYEVVPDDITAYITGSSLINQDFAHSSKEGLKKTEIITIGLILGLLLLVFRSLITPFVPLITVGFTYLISQSLLAILVENVDFPISTFTQTFLVAILFGIGTDYCILLLTRFREELANGHDKVEATVTAYRTAGRTLFISGIAVLIGFAAIGFAKFAVFQSAVGVAVGVGILILILFTLLPLFMVTLGEKLFWPSKKVASHSNNKLWHFLGRNSVARPVLFLVIAAIVTVPFVLTYDGQVSFDNTEEISSDYKSIKGLNAISEAVGEGKAFPVKVVIKEDEELTTTETIPYLENISKAIEKVDNVDSVMTITQPTGDRIEDLYIDSQLGEVSNGINDAVDGMKEVQSGLTEVQNGLSQIADQAGAGSGSGGSLSEATNGLDQINQQLQGTTAQLSQTGNVQQAVPQLQAISGQLGEVQAGLEQANAQLAGQQEQVGELTSSLNQLAEGVESANNGLTEISDGLASAADTLNNMSESPTVRDTGIYLPEETLENEDFGQSIDNYSFADGEGITMDVVLEVNPYSEEAIDTVRQIKEAVDNEIIDTPFENAEIAYGGVSSSNADLEELSTTDLSRTMVIMMVGLFIVLTILFRSMIMPVYMIASLLLTYYTAISIAEMIFVNLMDYSGISWAVPFFSFVILVALGIDYSIFLLDRFSEEVKAGIDKGMVTAMTKMGTVIITAAIILAGTFGAMMPSGVLTLVQVASVVIIGLLLYGLVILPLLVPSIVVTLGEGNWWPFTRKKDKTGEM